MTEQRNKAKFQTFINAYKEDGNFKMHLSNFSNNIINKQFDTTNLDNEFTLKNLLYLSNQLGWEVNIVDSENADSKKLQDFIEESDISNQLELSKFVSTKLEPNNLNLQFVRTQPILSSDADIDTMFYY